MPGGVERIDLEFVRRLRTLWAGGETKKTIAEKLEIDLKSVDYYRRKFGLPARRVTRYSNSMHSTSALTDNERAFFFAGLDRCE